MNARRPIIWPRSHRVTLVAVGLVLVLAAVFYPDEDGPGWVRVVCTAVAVGGGLVGLALLAVLAPRHADGGTLWGRPPGGGDAPADPGGRQSMTSENTADEVTAESVVSAPGGAASGWWDGLAEHGPGYAHGTVFVRRDPGQWDRPGVAGPVCPSCGMDRGLDLVWLEDRPDVARVRCSDGTAWPAPAAWATPAAVAWALAQDEAPTGHEAGPRVHEGDDVDPGLAYLAEIVRRHAGNTPPPSAGGAA